MTFKNRRATLELEEQTRSTLESISRSRSEPVHRVERAKILLDYANGQTVSAIARRLDTNRPKGASKNPGQ